MNWHRLSLEEQVGAVFIALMLLHLIAESVRNNSTPDTSRYPRPHPTREETLQHLENGHTVTIDRWHGTELTLQAVDQRPAVDDVVDIDQEETVDDDEE